MGRLDVLGVSLPELPRDEGRKSRSTVVFDPARWCVVATCGGIDPKVSITSTYVLPRRHYSRPTSARTPDIHG